ncbi:MAG TPA: hypothetical protein PKL83_03540 [bacterium]|nr:hypothetical protein [bacterium]
MKSKLTSSPTNLAILVILLSVLALGVWTGYTYFFFEPANDTPPITPTKHYNNELQSISKALEEYRTYQIDTSTPVDTGKDDPFVPF